MTRSALRLAVAVLLLVGPGTSAAVAQDSLPGPPIDTVTVRTPDTLAVPMTPPIGPGGALIRSLIIPGWGQAKMGRGLAAGFFLVIEGASLGMALKANSELKHFRETDDPRAEDKSQEREDWLVIMGVNHLLAGIEAYVSAYLWDFPGDLRLQATPNGTAATLSLPLRLP